MKHLVFAVIASLLTVTFVSSGASQGLIGGLIEGACGQCGLGDSLDEAHRDIKERNTVYRDIEEGVSDAVRHGTSEIAAETGGPVLERWIWASRANVISAGTHPIPAHIYRALVGFFPPDFLNSVSFRVGWGNEAALPALSFRFGDAAAIALVDVIMFRNPNDAGSNAWLWAHELTHIQQYNRWGVGDFSKRYLKDHGGVEAEANENANRWEAWYVNGSASNMTVLPASQPPLASGICRTPWGACWMNSMGPLGAQCYCAGPQGPMYGQISAQ